MIACRLPLVTVRENWFYSRWLLVVTDSKYTLFYFWVWIPNGYRSYSTARCPFSTSSARVPGSGQMAPASGAGANADQVELMVYYMMMMTIMDPLRLTSTPAIPTA